MILGKTFKNTHPCMLEIMNISEENGQWPIPNKINLEKAKLHFHY